jgi:Domain of unknown function (DUF4375)
LSDVCRRELFGDIQKLISDGMNADDAARLLLELDRQHAAEFLLSDAQLAPDSKSLHGVLQALNDADLTAPRVRLLFLIEKISRSELKYPQTRQLGDILRLLGKHQVPEDRQLLERHLTHRDESVVSGAAAGLLASHGLQGFEKQIWKVIEERGAEALTKPQRQYLAVSGFDGEVNNGGLSQYFFNSSGDEWRDAIAGLEAMQSKERLAILREALAKFGPAGPAEQRRERMTQLSKLENANNGVFRELDDRYYKCTESFNVMVMRFVLKTPEAFR